jgi:hypothetical protein
MTLSSSLPDTILSTWGRRVSLQRSCGADNADDAPEGDRDHPRVAISPMNCSLIVADSSEPGFGWTSAREVLEPGWLAFRSMRINGITITPSILTRKTMVGSSEAGASFTERSSAATSSWTAGRGLSAALSGADWNPVTSQSAQIRSEVCIETDLRGLGELPCFEDKRRSAINLEGKNLGRFVQCTSHNREKEDCVKTHLVQIRVVAIQ